MNLSTPKTWPVPPAALPHAMLDLPPNGARVAVAGLVLVRQRPGTANGVIFITLEDETGVCNVIVWRKLYETYRRAVISGRMLRVTGRIQREGAVCHVIAENVEDISFMLDELLLSQTSRATEQPFELTQGLQTKRATQGPPSIAVRSCKLVLHGQSQEARITSTADQQEHRLAAAFYCGFDLCFKSESDAIFSCPASVITSPDLQTFFESL